MSGIVGIVNLDGAPVGPSLLSAMTRSMALRGPDAQGIKCLGSAGLGNTLLRTARESAQEKQPASFDGKIWITSDARIDARGELISKLQTKGRDVPAASPDVELILHAYHLWGRACVEHLLGDFVFAIWDGPAHSLFCARDHFGVKPFFYARAGDSLVFSNSLDCVRLHPAVSDELNDLAIADFLLFDFNPDPASTAFVDISRLPAANTLECEGETLSVKCYWTLPAPEEIRYKRSAEYVDRFVELLDTAVADRLRTDSVGVLMSGGLDSPTVAASAQRVFARAGRADELHAYTDVYDRLIPHEERRYAGLVAQALRIPIHYRSADDSTLYGAFGDPAFRTPEPAHLPCGASMGDQLSDIASRGPVVLTGLGADPALCCSLSTHFRRLLRSGGFGRALGDMASFVTAEGRFSRLYLAKRWQILFEATEQQCRLPPWLNEDVEKRLGIPARWEQIERARVAVESVRPVAYESMVHPPWSGLLELYDPGATRVPIEVRHPFFDLRLLNFLLALPPLPLCSDKELLRRAARGVLPDEVRRRRKCPLPAEPLNAVLQEPESAWVDKFAPDPKLDRYVVRGLIPAVFGEKDILKAWVHLRPLSLNYWLQRYNF